MVQLPSRGVLIPALLALALVGTVLFASLGPEETRAPSNGSGGAPTATASAPAMPSTPGEVTPDEFCVMFLALVDASSTFTAAPDEESGDALVEAARALFEMPTPIGMSDGARVGLDQLVEGSLAKLSDVPEVEVDTAADESRTSEPDFDEVDLYLQATCPP